MLRRIAGIVLVLIGAFGIALAILLPTVVVPASKKTPLDLNITQVSSGNAKLLDAASGQERDVKLRATRVVRSDSHASDATNTTVNETLCIVIVQGNTPDCVSSSDPRLLSVTTDRVTTNRKSAEAVHVPKYHENINGDESARHTGLAYKFPIDTEKKTYQFFLPDLRKAFPARYLGTATVNGLDVYRFESSTGRQPYKIQGAVDGFYQDTRTVWVEPTTGTIVKGSEHQVQTLSDGKVALDTTLNFDKSAVDFQSSFAKKKLDQLKQAQLWLPLIAGIVGVLALVGGILLLRGRRNTSGDGGGGTHRPDATPPPSGPGQGQPPSYAGSSQT